MIDHCRQRRSRTILAWRGPFTGTGLDRAVNECTDLAWIARKLEDPASRAVVASRDGVLMGNDRMPSLRRVPLALDVVRVGFDADSDGGVPRARYGELEDVQWFERDGVHDALRDGNSELHLPPPISIARFLIERWVGLH